MFVLCHRLIPLLLLQISRFQQELGENNVTVASLPFIPAVISL
jgi:hypothetical protein